MWPLLIAGGILRTFAALRAQQAQAAQDEYNAKIADMAAGDAIARGQLAEGNVRLQTSSAISTNTAQYATAGVDVQSGSAVDVLASQRARGELAALTVRANAARTAWGYEVQAEGLRQHAASVRGQGPLTLIAGALGIGADMVGAKGGGTPGVDTPLIRVGEPTTPPVPFDWGKDQSIPDVNPMADLLP